MEDYARSDACRMSLIRRSLDDPDTSNAAAATTATVVWLTSLFALT